jgi:lysophospholipase L1-like esterase
MLKTRILPLLAASLFAAHAFAAADPLAPIDPAAYKAPVKVACIGDSITQGAGAGPGKAYPTQLQEMLGSSWKVGNFGVSGRTLLRKGDNPYWNEAAYQNALKSEPDVVIIMLGTNDTKPQNWQHEREFADDYKDLVQSFLDLKPKPRVYVCRPCPVPDPGAFGITEDGVKKEIPRIDKLAKALRLGVIDMYAALKKTPELLPDHVHPNAEGAGVMAATAFKALTGKEAPVLAPAH